MMYAGDEFYGDEITSGPDTDEYLDDGDYEDYVEERLAAHESYLDSLVGGTY